MNVLWSRFQMTPKVKLVSVVYCAALTCTVVCIAETGVVSWTESADPAVGRLLLSRPPARNDLEKTVFETPSALVEAYLRAQSTNASAEDIDAPVPSICHHWQVRVAIATNVVQLVLEASGVAFRASPAHPAQVSLFPITQVFHDLRLNGKPVTPMRLRDCWVNVAVTNPGPFIITATLDAKTVENGPERTLHLNSRGFSFSTVRIDSRDALKAEISTGGAITGTPEDGTHGVLTAGKRNSFSVTWRKAEPEKFRTGTPSVKPSVAWVVGEKRLSARGLLDVEILGGAVDGMAILLPEGACNAQLSGADIKYFTRSANRLDIFFRGAIRGRTGIDISFDVPRPRGNIVSFPEVSVPSGRIDTGGWLLVGNDGGGELLEQNVQGYEPRASIEAPEQVRGLLAGKPVFTYLRSGYRAAVAFDNVTTTPFPLVDTIADRADVIAALRAGGEEMVRVRYTVRNSRRQFLRVAMPGGATTVWVAVEKKMVRPAHDGGVILIPLAKSVQTMEGLVSFPVEIIYTRKGDPLARSTRRTVDLPELADVPTAVANVTVFTPEGTEIHKITGPLRMVKSFTAGGGFVYGRDYRLSGASNDRNISDQSFNYALSRNYYDAGYQAYRSGRFEDAERLLANVRKIAPDTPQVADADNLLMNIRAGRDEVKDAKTREERARVAKVQKQLQTDNPFLEVQREALVQKAVQMIETGNEEVGAELFDEAELVGRQLVQRGKAQIEEKAVAGKFKDTRTEMRRRKTENTALLERLSVLQQQAVEISVSAGKGNTNAVVGRNFAVALGEAAAANAVAADDIQSIAFGRQPVTAQPSADLDARVLALQMRNAPEQGANAPAAQRGGRSLVGENDRLRRQVAALEQALEKTRAAGTAQPSGQTTISDLQLKEARRQVAMTSELADSLVRRVEGPEVTSDALNEKELREKLASLKKTVVAYGNTYAALDPVLERNVNTVREKITSAETRMNRAIEAKRKADRVTIDLGSVVASDSRADQQALQRFFDNNVLRQVQNGDVQFSVSDGKMTVYNYGDNAAVVSEALDKLRSNRGLAVSVTGAALQIPAVDRLPVIGRLFNETTADGRKIAILDEGQYRALVEFSGSAANPERRDVIVGTPNAAGGEKFRIVRNARDYNGIAVGGREFNLPNDKYLAVVDSNRVTVLKAGTAVSWTNLDRDTVQNTTWDVPVAPEVPQAGTPILMEKTLLAAGESPDVVITYNYEERR